MYTTLAARVCARAPLLKMMMTMPDLSEPLDLAVVGLLAFFIPVAILANRVNLPFLTRGGGLLSYSKFAKGVTFGIALPSRLGMLIFSRLLRPSRASCCETRRPVAGKSSSPG